MRRVSPCAELTQLSLTLNPPGSSFTGILQDNTLSRQFFTNTVSLAKSRFFLASLRFWIISSIQASSVSLPDFRNASGSSSCRMPRIPPSFTSRAANGKACLLHLQHEHVFSSRTRSNRHSQCHRCIEVVIHGCKEALAQTR